MYMNQARDVYESGYGCIGVRLFMYMNQDMDVYESCYGCI